MELLPLNPYRRHRPTLIYFPGLDGTGRLFYRQQVDLSPHFNLLALVLPPDSLSPQWTAIATQVYRCLHNVLPVTPQYPLYLCGESFGGCLALAYAFQHPDSIAKLVLINPATAFDRCPWLELGIPLHRWLPEGVHPLTTLTGLPFLAALERLHPDDRRQLLRAMRTVSPAIVAERLALLQSFSQSGIDLARVHVPSLILASRRDRLLPSVEEAYRLNNHLRNATVQILPHSGHACLLEKDFSLGRILATRGWLPPSTVGIASGKDKKDKPVNLLI